jgi:lipopolysaccharide biosynthesis glycosyltransferase
MILDIVAGWERREVTGFNVAHFSVKNRISSLHRFISLVEDELRQAKLYWRPHEERNGQVWDVISDAPMATSFACSRFLTPWLSNSKWTLFCDFADMLFLDDLAKLFALADDRYAIMVVKHNYTPAEDIKMDDQIQTFYSRKNWSSLILWNVDHIANYRLTLDMVNGLPGRDLHRFCWLSDDEIGELPIEWNYLVGVYPPSDVATVKPKILHFTCGIPTMPGYESGPWSELWLDEHAAMESYRGNI